MKKIVVYISLIFLCYKSLAQNHIKIIQNVLNEEFEIISNDGVIFKTAGNDNLIQFINNKNKILNSGDYEFDDLSTRINFKNFEAIFNDSQVENFKLQLTNNYVLKYLELPNHIKRENFKNELNKENSKNGIPPETGIYYFTISNLVVSKNSQYILFEYSKGIPGNMIGGIKIYKKELHKNDYDLLAEANGWME
ncbi:hypothetical protein JM79_2075 [Gramella sp. Hel_I_59]|uniref:hypothetical protein n=1 Tax=Gramella sp. Hel_I_59 TaxID=1249978 RepID=UPI0011512D83|nr:hypothetical protein [Gramella sp. Hel_I_59]TQI71149.1 hypothetical protein JM79_2075 [Gramella sp. Hel_I_59]